ncbi:TetR/AcrR family transcriptional regulator [Streptomyces decoyicus]|uniref:TetR/AcrR family transcriptional regulator n=1 Tax=Streptomyces decoyicus TaxID=249567 RepID=UPI00386F0544|nr:TetR/AcrR family transcriptional regulator [Streptomyces decoyicus]
MKENPSSSPAPLIWTHPSPRRRRSPLERDDIVQAAVAVADEGGAQALTMTAVAKRLGPYTPMALYRYVLSKDGLTDLMLDSVTAEIPVPDEPGDDWRADLHAVAVETWAMVKRHLWYAQLMPTRPPLGPHLMRRTEFLLQVLVRQGLTVGEAMTYAALLDRHLLGSAQQEAEELAMRRRHGLHSPRQLSKAVTAARDLAAEGGRHPLLTEWMTTPSGAGMDEQFELSLAFLLDGIATRLPHGKGGVTA